MPQNFGPLHLLSPFVNHFWGGEHTLFTTRSFDRCSTLLLIQFSSGKTSFIDPVFNVPRHGKSLYKPHNTWVFLGKLSPRIPRLNAINTMVVHVCYGYIQLSLDSSHYLQAFIHHNWWSPTWDVWANLGMNRALKKTWGNHGINRISNTQCLGETPDAPDQSQQL